MMLVMMMNMFKNHAVSMNMVAFANVACIIIPSAKAFSVHYTKKIGCAQSGNTISVSDKLHDFVVFIKAPMID